MTDQDIIDTIAKALYRAHIEGLISFGKEAEKVLASLRDAGYAIVALPEPDTGPDGEGEYTWNTTVAQSNELTPDVARRLAAALLAAAEKAEEGK